MWLEQYMAVNRLLCFFIIVLVNVKEILMIKY